MYSKRHDLWPAQATLKSAGVPATVYDSLTVEMTTAEARDILKGLTTKAHKDAAAKAIEHIAGSKARQQERSNRGRPF